MEEMFDVYDENGKYLGVKTKSFFTQKIQEYIINQFGFGLSIQKTKS